jgi:hypothetical protein
MVADNLEDISLLHYMEQTTGIHPGIKRDCFALSESLVGSKWIDFCNEMENVLKYWGADGIYRVGRVWKCIFRSDEDRMRACNAILGLCRIRKLKQFTSDVISLEEDDLILEDEMLDYQEDENEECADEDMGIGDSTLSALRKRCKRLQKEIIGFSKQIGGIQKLKKARIRELEVVSVVLDYYEPEGKWGKEAEKWQKK